MKPLSIVFFTLALASCKLKPGPDKKYSDPESITYHLRLNPDHGAEYYYDITNATHLNLEINGQEIDNSNKTTVGINYVIKKDSSDQYIFTISYDKIHVHVKSGDRETDADANNAKYSLNPSEKILGAVKAVTFAASVNKQGNIKLLRGYKELSDELMLAIDDGDENARTMMKKQLERSLGQGMVQKNLDQLFRIFPDSAIRVGDKWKISSQEKGEFDFSVKTIYKLKDINNEIAFVNSESNIETDKTTVTIMGYTVVPDLKGTQQGKYELESKTGMLRKATINSQLKGTVKLSGKELPVEIKIKVEIDGKRVK